ncbi:MAG: UDP-N-acetylmuramate dehydrogenase, partial [Acidimicrobiales bacterium]|nr:UDP-N-acetylmuramate dehydrogenase [Acidimicrobiales bacterium]
MGSSGDLMGLAEDLLSKGLLEGVKRRHPLGPLTTYRVGGSAALFVRPTDQEELVRVAEATASAEVRLLLVGRGSNMLVSDEGFEGLAVQLGPGFERIRLSEGGVVAGGAAGMPVVARRSVVEGLTGFEWAVGVPGSIGGAVRMNAGGHGSDLAAVLRSAWLVDLASGDRSLRTVEELDLGYRSSAVAPSQVVVEADLSLRPGSAEDGERLLAEIVRWRRENQPGGQNSGSVFTNPSGDSAGRLIDLVGARGLRIGTARVSEKHANFILAERGGLAADV